MRDLRYAVRLLLKAPVFTATAVLTLALCIGANTAIFSAVYALMLKPLPFAEPARLVEIYNTFPKGGVPRASRVTTRKPILASARLKFVPRSKPLAGGTPKSIGRTALCGPP